jgi:hypothetical protein
MKEFLVWNSYPTNVNKHKLEKNFGLAVLLIIAAVIFWYIFNTTSIAAGSNIIRGLLFITLAAVAFWKINETAKEVNLTLDEDHMLIGSTKINYNEVYGFDIVDLTDYLEILIVTTKLTNQFEYIYIPSNSPDAAEITKLLLDNIQYVEHLNDRDLTHKLLRRVHIK